MSDIRIDSAMVMAAGLGKRMRPLTATRPKPLIKVAGRALLDHAIDRIVEAGIRRVVVNVHYLADSLEAHVRQSALELEIIISDERGGLLETGGGMVKAQDYLGEPFLCANSDNIWIDGPVNTVELLARQWDAERMDALLLLVPHARANCHGGPGDFQLDGLGRISRRARGKVAPFVFTGVQLVSKRLLRDAPEGAFSTNLLWDRAIEEGRLYGVVHQGLWFDVGTPQAIPKVEAIIAGE